MGSTTISHSVFASAMVDCIISATNSSSPRHGSNVTSLKSTSSHMPRPTSSERASHMAGSRVISKSEESLAVIEDNTKPGE